VGEIAQNASSTALAPTTASLPLDSLSPGVQIMLELRALRIAVGLIFGFLVLAGLWSRRRRISLVEGYLTGYIGILLIWPFDDTRFIAPIIPLLFTYAWLGLRALNPPQRGLRCFVVSYCVIFCFLGAVAMGDCLRVTYFDRLRPWRECRGYLLDIPTWLEAYHRYGGLRSDSVDIRKRVERVVPDEIRFHSA
jgi:hypothetical protein